MSRLKFLIALIVISVITVWLSIPIHALEKDIDKVLKLLPAFGQESYVLIEKIDCADSEITNRYVAIYEKTKDKHIVRTHAAEISQAADEYACVAEEETSCFEGVYYKPKQKILTTEHSYCSQGGYNLRFSVYALNILEETTDENIAYLPTDTLYQRFMDRDSTYQIDKKIEKGRISTTTVKINYSGLKYEKAFPGDVDTDLLANGYNIKTDDMAFKAGSLLYDNSQVVQADLDYKGSLLKVYDLESAMCLDLYHQGLGDCCGNEICEPELNEDPETCPDDCSLVNAKTLPGGSNLETLAFSVYPSPSPEPSPSPSPPPECFHNDECDDNNECTTDICDGSYTCQHNNCYSCCTTKDGSEGICSSGSCKSCPTNEISGEVSAKHSNQAYAKLLLMKEFINKKRAFDCDPCDVEGALLPWDDDPDEKIVCKKGLFSWTCKAKYHLECECKISD